MAEKVTPIGERDQLAAAVGYALDEWTQVEITLNFIFCSVFDDTKTPLPQGYTEWSELSVTQRMLHSIMDAIIGFDTRIDVISAAVGDANISPSLKTIWGKLNSRLKKKYKSRHQIAHFMILEIEEEGKPTCYRLTPFATSTTTNEEVRLQTGDVNTKKQNFHELREALLWFGNQVEFEKKRIEAPHLPTPVLIERVLQALKDQKTQAQTSPGQSSRA